MSIDEMKDYNQELPLFYGNYHYFKEITIILTELIDSCKDKNDQKPK